MTDSTLPALMPMLSYADGAAAIDWLVGAFGFTERLRLANDDGTIGHAELALGDAVVALATAPKGYEGPRRHRETCAASREWQQVPWVINGLMVYVDDVDAHAARARAAGATLLSEPEDTGYGDRNYRVEDLEGNRWMFSQHLRDVDPAEWGATTS
jgi:uncharacterized glyoxalase superfamily protein PhnB